MIFLKYPSRDRNTWTGVVLHEPPPPVSAICGVDDDGSAALASISSRPAQSVQISPGCLPRRSEGVLQVGDLAFERVGLLNRLRIFLVDVAELDLRHVLGLHLVDAEADHQVGDDLGLALGLADDGDGLVDVEQDLA